MTRIRIQETCAAEGQQTAAFDIEIRENDHRPNHYDTNEQNEIGRALLLII